MCRRASAKLSSKWRFRKISMNFKAKRSSFSRIFSLFTLDGYGKVVLALGMTTGSSIWTIGGWTSSVLSLGSTVSFVTSVSTSTTGAGQLRYEVAPPQEHNFAQRASLLNGSGTGTENVCLVEK
ncbi:hypothetical protein Tco_1044525 [Tanacetum coccineum]|uniref:Uncharacterized protein n=1 Tax=Tanacetum coccineum TaxID=301880 RepID=A0ABQ5GQW3_9ASTR